MNTIGHNKLISFIWSIADDCLRDVYVRGKYRDVILPMVVLRRLDTLLEPTKEKVLEEIEFQIKELELTELDDTGICAVSEYVFYNKSKWTLQQLHSTASNSKQILVANFEEYLDGFSENVQEIIKNFKLKDKVREMAEKDVLLDVIEKFVSPSINFTPFEKEDTDGYKLPALTNLGMGYVFEELIRKFNEENNEEAGEHFTPREVIDLMTHLVFMPIKDKLPPVITMYDPACGSGGMLTESQNFIIDPDGEIKSTSKTHLYGKEINSETYAICKSDMMIKGNDPKNIKLGSTLATNDFAGTKFDFMLSNPPYGKSWNTDVKYIKEKKEVIDGRFLVELKDYFGVEETADATPRTSDGQLLFMMEMIDKMKSKEDTPLGSRIASVHNGSSLFTGDAGSGESNIRRYIIENDLLEGIVQLPNNLFYNTGITTYIWLLNNNKPINKKGKVQLIDANSMYEKLRKNLGDKNCELKPHHIEKIQEVYNEFKDVEKEEEKSIAAKVFDNSDFGYYKVVIERPARLKAQFTEEAIADLRYDKSVVEAMKWAYETYGERIYTELDTLEKDILKWCEDNGVELNAKKRKILISKTTWEKRRNIYNIAVNLMKHIGGQVYMDFNTFKPMVDKVLKEEGMKVSPAEKNAIYGAITEYHEDAEKVVKKKQKLSKDKLETLLERLDTKEENLANYGYYSTGKDGEYITYEASSDLRDNENVPLKEEIEDYFLREVKPHVEEAWIDLEKTKIGYEISFNKYFYEHKKLRDIDKVASEILSLEQENEGLIMEILGVK